MTAHLLEQQGTPVAGSLADPIGNGGDLLDRVDLDGNP
jgi:hypothetical protein